MRLYKSTNTEFEIQARAFITLKEVLGNEYDVRGEYAFSTDGRGCRPDISIFKRTSEDTLKLILVIEVKKNPYGQSKKQGDRYSTALKVPCVYCRGMKDAKRILEIVRPFLN